MHMDDWNKYPGEFVLAAATVGKLSIETLRGYAALGGLRDQTGHLKLKIRDGLDNYLSVSVAQTQALAAQIIEVQVRTRQCEAAVALIRALGGGWATK